MRPLKPQIKGSTRTALEGSATHQLARSALKSSLSPVESGSSTVSKELASKALGAAFAATFKASRMVFDSSRMTYALGWPSVGLHQLEECQTELRAISRKLKALSSSQLELGSRMEYMREALDDHIHNTPSLFTDSINRLLHTSDSYLGSETKVAALRYLGVYDSPIPLSELSKIFVSALKGPSEPEAIAAARSLADMGDTGSIPAMNDVVRGTNSEALKAATESAIKDIVETYGYHSGS